MNIQNLIKELNKFPPELEARIYIRADYVDSESGIKLLSDKELVGHIVLERNEESHYGLF